jgi:hypothetical protein
MNLRKHLALGCVAWGLSFAAGAGAAGEAPPVTDLVYATVNGKSLGLDLHLPAGVTHPPLLVFVHRWRLDHGQQGPIPGISRGARFRGGEPGLPFVQ